MTAPVLTAPALAAAGLPHGFLGRRGGVSGGIYASLNCGQGSDDDPACVAENRRRALAASGLSGAALQTVYQVHGAEVVTLDGPLPEGTERPRADAMATRQPGLALGILTADCVPLLFADPQAGVVAAAHAGWRGTLAGVAEATLAAMERLGARRTAILAAIGPAIGPASYEVGPDFPAPFLDADPAADRFFRPAQRVGPMGRHWLFDLTGYLAARLRAAGTGTVEDMARDTLTDEGGYFSHRRGTLRGAPDYGRQIALIGLPDGPAGSGS